jgi:hypothetical protein
MTESAVNQSTHPADGRPSKETTRTRPAYLEEEGAFPRLQERTQTQLGFINSLLVTLAVGLLAFAVNASASSTELNRLGWREWLLFVGLVTLALSVLSGLRLALNRLASHRITTRVARLRQLRDRYRSESREYELRRLGRQSVFFQTWAKYSWSKVPEKKQVHGAARDLAALIPEEYKLRKQERATSEKVETPAKPDADTISPAAPGWWRRFGAGTSGLTTGPGGG